MSNLIQWLCQQIHVSIFLNVMMEAPPSSEWQIPRHPISRCIWLETQAEIKCVSKVRNRSAENLADAIAFWRLRHLLRTGNLKPNGTERQMLRDSLDL